MSSLGIRAEQRLVIDCRGTVAAELPALGSEFRIVGRIRSPFHDTPGTPIQPAYASGGEGQVVFCPEFAPGLDDTPLLDLEPNVPAFDAPPSARAGWLASGAVDRQHADDRFHGPAASPRDGEP